MVEEEKVPEMEMERARAEEIEQILSLIREHPEGIRLVEMEERTGLARIKIGSITRMLLDEGKIRKEDLLYLPPEEEKVPEVELVAELIKVPEEVTVMAEVEKEQGPLLDLIDKITDKETTLDINIEDVGGRLFGRSLRLMGRVKFDLGTLKKPK